MAICGAVLLAGVSALAVRHGSSPKPVVLVPQATTTIHCGDNISVSIVAGNDLNCSSGHGLLVGANAITINLNGHTLTGCGSCGTGIGNFNSHSGVTIENGSVVGWHDNDVFTNGATNRVIGIHASKAGLSGLVATGAGSTISGSVVFQNTSSGIVAGSANVHVTSNVARENATGISITGSGAVVQTNQSENNTALGIYDNGTATTITGNVTNGNGGDGINSAPDATSTVGTNTANYNGSYGIEASPGGKDGGGNLAKGNTQAAQCKDVVCA